MRNVASLGRVDALNHNNWGSVNYGRTDCQSTFLQLNDMLSSEGHFTDSIYADVCTGTYNSCHTSAQALSPSDLLL